MIDLRQDTYSLQPYQPRCRAWQRIASTGVEAKIAQQANVPYLLRIQAPLTPAQPTPPVDSQTARQVSDILKSNDHTGS